MTSSLIFPPNSRFVLVRGQGSARRALNAFDAALLAAGVGNFNLIRISSILPPEAIQGTEIPLRAGARLPVAYSSEVVEEPGHRISAAIGVAVPADTRHNGVIMEFHAHGTADDAERIVREMAADAMELRNLDTSEIISAAIETISGDQPTAVFAGAALIPADAYAT